MCICIYITSIYIDGNICVCVICVYAYILHLYTLAICVYAYTLYLYIFPEPALNESYRMDILHLYVFMCVCVYRSIVEQLAYRMCSLTTECVLLLRMCSLTIECVSVVV
jgi:hypothetical protein